MMKCLLLLAIIFACSSDLTDSMREMVLRNRVARYEISESWSKIEGLLGSF